MLFFIPVILFTIKEFLPVAFVLSNLVSFKSVFVPIIILFTVATPLVSGVNYYIDFPFLLRNLTSQKNPDHWGSVAFGSVIHD